jgi:hypothetical protein
MFILPARRELFRLSHVAKASLQLRGESAGFISVRWHAERSVLSQECVAKTVRAGPVPSLAGANAFDEVDSVQNSRDCELRSILSCCDLAGDAPVIAIELAGVETPALRNL